MVKWGNSGGALGFGFAELGTVTWHPQPGNPPPRLFRLIEDQAALNRMGFNNCGAKMMAQNLTPVRSPELPPIPIGINLGKSKVTALEEAMEDYRDSFEVLQGLGDYFVVNVSSPNTPGLRSLQAPERLEQILKTLMDINADAKPILVKIAPDLETGEIQAILDLALELDLGGSHCHQHHHLPNGVKNPTAGQNRKLTGGRSRRYQRRPSETTLHRRDSGNLAIHRRQTPHHRHRRSRQCR